VVTFSVAVTDAANGWISLSLTASQTAAMSLSEGIRWDMEETISGTVNAIFYGNVYTMDQVTT